MRLVDKTGAFHIHMQYLPGNTSAAGLEFFFYYE